MTDVIDLVTFVTALTRPDHSNDHSDHQFDHRGLILLHGEATLHRGDGAIRWAADDARAAEVKLVYIESASPGKSGVE